MIVMKFGGTSVGSAEAIQRVCSIVRSRLKAGPVVVVSAIDDVTDILVDISVHAAKKDRAKVYELILQLIKKHLDIIATLGLKNLQPLLLQVEQELKNTAEIIMQAGHSGKHITDQLLSLGEYLAAHILSAGLINSGIKSQMADAREIIVTDSQFGKAQAHVDETRARVRDLLVGLVQSEIVPVMQGFVGRDSMNRTTTLGRGGSDYTATLVGNLAEAESVEIWSDVDGILTADPTLVADAKRIRYMSFQEAAELAYFGAKVLHPAMLIPAMEKGIPVYVLNSRRPQEPGTRIAPKQQQTHSDTCIVKSIAYKENITVVTVTSTRMLMAFGFLASIFDVFNRYQTSVDLVSTSEVSVSMTIDNSEKLPDIRKELARFAQVEVHGGKAIVCVVGENLKKTPDIPARIFSVLSDVSIHLISQGASEINISFVIDEAQLPRVITTLHGKFFSGELDPEVFAP